MRNWVLMITRYNMPFRQMDPWLFVIMFNVDILCAFVFTRNRSTITILLQTVNTFHFCPWPLLSCSGNRWFSLFLLTGLSVHQRQCWTEGTRKWNPWTQAQDGRLSNSLRGRFRQSMPGLLPKAVLFPFMPLENPPKKGYKLREASLVSQGFHKQGQFISA